MNRREWLEACKNHVPGIYKWYNECLKIRKSLQYNQDPNATHKHHLFNTPEQIAYNNEHYEMWGFNLDGTFEYGKYIIFVTPEEHSMLHSESEITRQRKGNAARGEKNYFYGTGPMLGKHFSEEHKRKIGESNTGKKRSDEARKKMSDAAKGKHSGENNGMYGKFGKDNPNYGSKRSDETRAKMIKSWNEERRQLSKEKFSCENNPMYGKHHTDETKQKLREARLNQILSEEFEKKRQASLKIITEKVKNLYKEYKSLGGKLKWNEFRKELAKNKHNNEYSLEGLV